MFICGPTPFMDLVEAGAAAAGVPADRIAIERFLNAAIDLTGGDELADEAADGTPVDEPAPARTRRHS